MADSNPTINTDPDPKGLEFERFNTDLRELEKQVLQKLYALNGVRYEEGTSRDYAGTAQSIMSLITSALRARETEIELNALKWVVSESRAGRNGVWLQERQSSQGKQSTVHDRIAQLESEPTTNKDSQE